MTKLIVNADDLGLSLSVNRGIIDAHTDGIVTSTTWLAGGTAAEEAVELARPHRQLEVGLHLALTDVRPVGDPSPFRSVLGADGRWPTGFASVVRWMQATPYADRAVLAEWRMQLIRFTDRWGRTPSHLDSHQHIALLPGLMPHLVELAVSFGVRAVRVPSEVRGQHTWPVPRAWHRLHETLVLSALARRLRRLVRESGLIAPTSFAGFRQSGRMDEATLLALLPRLAARKGAIELMVHPGTSDEGSGYRRRQERDALMSPRVRTALDRHGLHLSRFSDLP